MRREKLNEYLSDILFALALTFIVFIGTKGDIPFIATAFGASVYMSFINPYSKYSTPWNISASYVAAALYGIILNNVLKHEFAANNIFYVFVAFIIFALYAQTITYIKAEHPPAAAVLISFAYTEATFSNILLFSCLMILMIIIDFVFEQLLKHKKELTHLTEEEIKTIQEKILKNINPDNHNYKYSNPIKRDGDVHKRAGHVSCHTGKKVS